MEINLITLKMCVQFTVCICVDNIYFYVISRHTLGPILFVFQDLFNAVYHLLIVGYALNKDLWRFVGRLPTSALRAC